MAANPPEVPPPEEPFFDLEAQDQRLGENKKSFLFKKENLSSAPPIVPDHPEPVQDNRLSSRAATISSIEFMTWMIVLTTISSSITFHIKYWNNTTDWPNETNIVGYRESSKDLGNTFLSYIFFLLCEICIFDFFDNPKDTAVSRLLIRITSEENVGFLKNLIYLYGVTIIVITTAIPLYLVEFRNEYLLTLFLAIFLRLLKIRKVREFKSGFNWF